MVCRVHMFGGGGDYRYDDGDGDGDGMWGAHVWACWGWGGTTWVRGYL